MNTTTEHIDTVVIGAGQAGLATGYHLARHRRQFVILDGNDRIGDIWRKRFDSLRLYSPAWVDGLPGLPFPAARWEFPSKDAVADYLEEYARRFQLPVRTGIAVRSVEMAPGGGYLVDAGGSRIVADNIVVATGGFATPVTPAFATELAPDIRQLHSNEYRNPSQLQDGPVLVVGASHSGGDVALEVASSHPTTLAGPIHGEIPVRLGSWQMRLVFPMMVFAARHVLTVRTPMGRKMAPEVRGHGGPLLRVKRTDLISAGVEIVEQRVVGTQGGLPVLADGRALDVSNVIWCTGFVKDVSWIHVPVTGDDGWPETDRGVVTSAPGLYFVGVPFQFGFASMLLAGVARDAEHVVQRLVRQPIQGPPTGSVTETLAAGTA